MINTKVKPFTKWTGGKRQLLSHLRELVPEDFNNYYEPFVGAGALLFDLKPNHAIINDFNSDLINAYKIIKDNPNELINELTIHDRNNSKDYFFGVRNWDRNGMIDNKNDIQKAARILYMLRVDFNGLYRVNKKNQFNAPYGRYKNPNIINKENILAVSDYLNSIDISINNDDFENVVKSVTNNDFIYLDPPYIPLNPTSSFTSYTSKGFNIDDQKRLRNNFFELSNKGAYVMLSNSDTKLTRELYEGANIHTIKAKRSINSKGNKRGKINELIITNY